MGQILGVSGTITGPHFRWFYRIFVARVLRKGFKVFVAKKGIVAIPFMNLLVVVVGGGCWH